jgi:hypothetical protein
MLGRCDARELGPLGAGMYSSFERGEAGKERERETGVRGDNEEKKKRRRKEEARERR